MRSLLLSPLCALLVSGCVFPSPNEETNEALADGSTATQSPLPTTPGTPPEPGQLATGAGEENTGIPASDGGLTEPPDDPSEPFTPPSGPCDFDAAQVVDVANAGELVQALAHARPGSMIRLAAGKYTGDFVGTIDGSAAEPIVLCGPNDAELSADSNNEDSFNLLADHWILSGFSITGGLRGLVVDGGNFNQFLTLTVASIGQEAIHLRSHSSDNLVHSCRIFNTGTQNAGFGEGVYIGSAESNWDRYTGSANTPDRSDRNQIISNVIGPNVRAEHIDIKEGTQGGVIRGNTFDGKGMSGDNYADSWIDVKGNDYLIEENVGTDAIEDGFQTHVVKDIWGHNITFRQNTARVNSPGYGINVSGKSSGVIVGCDNTAEGAAQGLSNLSCALIP